MSKTFATMFSGGGLADVGMMQAGWTPLWGIEYDPDIAAVYAENVHACIMVADVRNVDYAALKRPDHLHASPVCKNASVANSNGEESPVDMETAEAVCRAIRALRPDTFTLENVYGYRNFKAYQGILRTLCDEGYEIQQHHCNAADYGVAQTRKRLILRASRVGRMKPLQPTHSEFPQAQGLFDAYAPLLPWNGWYAAIEDLIPTLPESRFAPWQLERLPQELKGNSMLWNMDQTQREVSIRTQLEPVPTVDTGMMRRPSSIPQAFLVTEQYKQSNLCDAREPQTFDASAPSPTVMAEHKGKFRAFLVSDQSGAAGEGLQIAQPEEPATTIRAGQGGGAVPRAFVVHPNDMRTMPTRDEDEPIFTVMATGDTDNRPNAGFKPRAWLSQGRVVSMTPRALARFQSVPDWYELPTKKLACTIIGNGVCCLLMQRIAESLP